MVCYTESYVDYFWGIKDDYPFSYSELSDLPVCGTGGCPIDCQGPIITAANRILPDGITSELTDKLRQRYGCYCKDGNPINNDPGNCAWISPDDAEGKDLTALCTAEALESAAILVAGGKATCTNGQGCPGCGCCFASDLSGPTNGDGICVVGPACNTNLANCPSDEGDFTNSPDAYCMAYGSQFNNDYTCLGTPAAAPGEFGGACLPDGSDSDNIGDCTEGSCVTEIGDSAICLVGNPFGAGSIYANQVVACTGANQRCVYPIFEEGPLDLGKCVYSVDSIGFPIVGTCMSTYYSRSAPPASDDECEAAGGTCANDIDDIDRIPGGEASWTRFGDCIGKYRDDLDEGTTDSMECFKPKAQAGGYYPGGGSYYGTTTPVSGASPATDRNSCYNQNGICAASLEDLEVPDESQWKQNGVCNDVAIMGTGAPAKCFVPISGQYIPAGCPTDATHRRLCMSFGSLPPQQMIDGMSQVKVEDVWYVDDKTLACTDDDVCCPVKGDLCLIRVSDLPCQSSGSRARQCVAPSEVSGLAPSGWDKDTTLACSSNDMCCVPKGKICVYKEEPQAAGLGMNVTPSTTDKKIKTSCQVLVNFTQNNAFSCYDGLNLTVFSASAKPFANMTFRSTSGKPCYWHWRVQIPSDGNYAFSVTKGGSEIFRTNYTAQPAAPLTCPPTNCDSSCRANSSFNATRVGCGLAPCGPFQALAVKHCSLGGSCGSTSINYCVDNDPVCSPQVTPTWTPVNIAGTNQFNASLSANISGYPGKVNGSFFFIDGRMAGFDPAPPYEANAGPYYASSNHTYNVTMMTVDGNFSSASYRIMIPTTIPTPVPAVSCETGCSQYMPCRCGVTGCAEGGTAFVANARQGSAMRRPISNGTFTFTPAFPGNHSLQAVCGDSASAETRFSIPATALSFSFAGAQSCGSPDRKMCKVNVTVDKPVPLDLFVVGGGRDGKGGAYASLNRFPSGWNGTREISFTDITYWGTGPYTLYLFAYPLDVSGDLPASFLYSRELANVN